MTRNAYTELLERAREIWDCADDADGCGGGEEECPGCGEIVPAVEGDFDCPSCLSVWTH